MNNKITVEIGYVEFNFTDVSEAVAFAQTARKTITEEYKDRDIKVTVIMEGENE